MVELDNVRNAELQRFWIVENRYINLRGAFQDLSSILDVSSAWVQQQMKALGIAHSVPNPKSLDRLRKPGDKPLKGRPRELTALLHVCKQLSARLSTEQRLKQSIADLLQMANDFATECPNYPLLTSAPLQPEAEPAGASSSDTRVYQPDELAEIYDAINLPSTNDPKRPEFPYLNPRFPATPVKDIKLANGRVVWIKDESCNPTGSHKDRWAWEQIVKYKVRIKAALASGRPTALQAVSMISFGSSALALQDQLRQFHLPDLRVIVDEKRAGEYAIRRLRHIGCRVFPVNLDDKFLEQNDVLRITENELGIDITSRDVSEAFASRFYDWLAYEILNEDPRHIFVPVGTGDLFANIVMVIAQEWSSWRPDPRLTKGIKLRPIGLYGITTNEHRTLLDKLYAKFRPTHAQLHELIRSKISEKVLLKESRLYEGVSEDRIREAKAIADSCNIVTEFSGIAGLALFLEIQDMIPKRDKVLIVNTGRFHFPEP